jgi:hypothetical protein
MNNNAFTIVEQIRSNSWGAWLKKVFYPLFLIMITHFTGFSQSAGPGQTICRGGSATLTASGGTAYLWSTGATTASITISPIQTTTFRVTITHVGGPTIDEVDVTVQDRTETLSAGQDLVISVGQSATLTASTSITPTSLLTWSNSATGTTTTVSPITTTDYTVMANVGECNYNDIVRVTVVPSSSPLLCEGTFANPKVLLLNDAGQLLLQAGNIVSSVGANPIAITSIQTLGGMPLSSPLVCAQAGQTLMVQVSETGTMAPQVCMAFIRPVDLQAPRFVRCDTVRVPCYLTPANLDIEARGGIEISENCTFNTVVSTLSDVPSPVCTNSWVRRITRRYVATDLSGNASTCDQIVDLIRDDIANVLIPTAPVSLQCNQNPNDLTLTGQPSINSNPLSQTNNCNLSWVSDDKQIGTGCGQSRQICRVFTVTDCQGNKRTASQVISIVDTQAPSFTVQPTFNINTNSGTCAGTADFRTYVFNQSDNCTPSSQITITASFAGMGIGTGLGPFNNIPRGSHIVTFIARDLCGNESTRTATVIVTDNETPTVSCKTNLVVGLPGSVGLTQIPAIDLNNGSTDNCAPGLTFRVARMGGAFGPTLSLSCSDVNTTLTYILEATEAVTGNLRNTAMCTIFVQDKQAPTLICPADATISCRDLTTAPIITANAIAIDNCTSPVVPTVATVTDIDKCKNGSIVRTFTVSDQYANTSTCTQRITVRNETRLLLSDITWPADFMSMVCNKSLHPDSIPSVNRRPIVNSSNLCGLVAMEYRDETFRTSGNACYKVFRKWTVIDCCVYDPNYSGPLPVPGRFEYQQVLTVMDVTAPTVTCPVDSVRRSVRANCMSPFINIPVPTNFVDCSNVITVTNNSPFAASNQGAASGTYPRGTTNFRYFITDGCGNSRECPMRVIMVDSIKPTIKCLSGVSSNMTLMPAGYQAVANISDFTIEISDNCTLPRPVTLGIRFAPAVPDMVFPTGQSLIAGCARRGTNNVEIWARDASGNEDYCRTTFTATDNMNMCPPVAPKAGIVGGAIQDANSNAVENVTVNISKSGTSPLLTNAAGSFNFANLDFGYDYTVNPVKTDEITKGVNTLDLSIISNHILGRKPLASPYQMVAADINNNGRITASDISELRKIILGIETNFPNNKPWKFIDASYQIKNLSNPLIEVMPELCNINNLQTDKKDVNFISIKMGDLDYSSSSANGIDVRTAQHLKSTDKNFNTGEMLEIPMFLPSENGGQGLQFSLSYDENLLELVEKPSSNLNSWSSANSHILKNAVNVSWDGEMNSDSKILFSFRAKGNGKISEALNFGNAISPEFYFNNQGSHLGLTFEGAENSLYQNMPNPFSDKTVIGFNMANAGEASISIFDSTGKLMKKIQGQYSEGEQNITISSSELSGPGMYFYQLNAGNYSASKRLILIP